VEAEGLKPAGNGEEDQGRRGEDAKIEVDQASRFQEPVRRGHASLLPEKYK
jgi:hypothetical protein